MGIPGQALFVLLPLYVIDIGGTPAAAAAVIGWRGFGMLIMGLPAGWMASYLGYRSTMLIASGDYSVGFYSIRIKRKSIDFIWHRFFTWLWEQYFSLRPYDLYHVSI